MSTNHESRNKTRPRLPEGESKTVTPVSAPAPMTDDKLTATREPEADLEDADAVDGVPVFAIAHRRAVVQDHESDHEHEAVLVLYATRDGERVCERRFGVRANTHPLTAVERAFIAPEAALSPTGENARRFAPVVREHGEVA